MGYCSAPHLLLFITRPCRKVERKKSRVEQDGPSGPAKPSALSSCVLSALSSHSPRKREISSLSLSSPSLPSLSTNTCWLSTPHSLELPFILTHALGRVSFRCAKAASNHSMSTVFLATISEDTTLNAFPGFVLALLPTVIYDSYQYTRLLANCLASRAQHLRGCLSAHSAVVASTHDGYQLR